MEKKKSWFFSPITAGSVAKVRLKFWKSANGIKILQQKKRRIGVKLHAGLIPTPQPWYHTANRIALIFSLRSVKCQQTGKCTFSKKKDSLQLLNSKTIHSAQIQLHIYLADAK